MGSGALTSSQSVKADDTEVEANEQMMGSGGSGGGRDGWEGDGGGWGEGPGGKGWGRIVLVEKD